MCLSLEWFCVLLLLKHVWHLKSAEAETLWIRVDFSVGVTARWFCPAFVLFCCGEEIGVCMINFFQGTLHWELLRLKGEWFALRVLSKGTPQENIVNILKWCMNIGCHQFLSADSINLWAALNQPFYVQLKEKILLLKWGMWTFQSGGGKRDLSFSFSCMHQINFSL